MASIISSLEHPVLNNIRMQLNENFTLYSAQKAANQIFQNYSFPKGANLIEETKNSIFVNKVCNVIKTFNLVVYKTYSLFQAIVVFGISTTLFIGDYFLGWLLRPIVNYICPINPINGKRAFHLLPKSFEKRLGEFLYKVSADYETNELLQGTKIPMAEKVRKVFDQMIKANSKLLNSLDENVKFNYQVKTVPSYMINAYALPAGGIVVYSRIVKEINDAIRNKTIRFSEIHFPNGSNIKVDLSDVKLDDVLAALLGHEMTHVASRHANSSIFLRLITKIIVFISNLIFINWLKTKNIECERLKDKTLSSLNVLEKQKLEESEDFYEEIHELLMWIEEKISNLVTVFKSRQNEYEADTTGIYFAHKANYNPLGALFLHEFLKQYTYKFMHKNFEFLYTHPYAENRKLAAFAAINEIDQKNLQKHSIR